MLAPEITEYDQELYRKLVTVELSDEMRHMLENPEEVHYRQDSVLAVHWHPEFIPMPVISRRVERMFPNSDLELLIPTQHNVLMTHKGYTGVEVDCYSREFNRKVQLLVHFEEDKVTDATVFKNMLSHTFKYRTGQLYEFIDTILEIKYEDRLSRAAAKTGADSEMVSFIRACTAKVKKLLEMNFSETPPEMIRNKLLKYYLDLMRDHFEEHFINRAQIFLKAIKKIVKANFSLKHFYETPEMIEEIRSLGGGIVIPHPEQFWPILLADYDVDGYEVWNPQSQEYTKFLIDVVHRKNSQSGHKRRILVFMGDDCHMGEKVKEPRFQDFDKASRQIGYQPPWDDPAIRKSLILGDIDRRTVINEYKERLQ